MHCLLKALYPFMCVGSVKFHEVPKRWYSVTFEGYEKEGLRDIEEEQKVFERCQRQSTPLFKLLLFTLNQSGCTFTTENKRSGWQSFNFGVKGKHWWYGLMYTLVSLLSFFFSFLLV